MCVEKAFVRPDALAEERLLVVVKQRMIWQAEIPLPPPFSFTAHHELNAACAPGVVAHRSQRCRAASAGRL